MTDKVDTGWQTTISKNKRPAQSFNNLPIKKFVTTEDNLAGNRFAVLSSLQNNQDEAKSNELEEPKPPPIYIPNVMDIKKMTKAFNNVVNQTEYNFKTTTGGNVRLMCKTVDCFRKVVSFLDKEEIAHHTYQLKQERAFRVVIKNIHFSTPVEDIKEELENNGHIVRNIINARSRINKKPLSMFFVDLEPNKGNKNVYSIRSISNALVIIEPPKKFKEVVQCFRCQEFGHTKKYCKKSFRCVKCGMDHSTISCNKVRDLPAKCVNCNQNHPANYKGCEVYQNALNIQKRTMPLTKKFVQSHQFSHSEFPSASGHIITEKDNLNSSKPSYAAVLKGTQMQENPFEKIEGLLAKQIELTNNLFSLITVLIGKLCN